MTHILIAGKMHEAGLALAEAADVTLDYVEDLTEAGYVGLLPRADALILRTQPLTTASIASAPRLRMVSRHGVGFDAVDVDALTARGIPLAIVGDVNSVSVAEHAMTLILACAKHVAAADAAVRAGDWAWRNAMRAREVAGKRLLILGYGRIGRRLARHALAFDLEVRAYDPPLLAAGWPDGPVAPAPDLGEALAWADIVSINMPKVAAPMIGPAELAAMRPGAILVNTARGGLVDETALAEALRNGHLAAAALDVLDAEPPAPDHPLMRLENALLTPHIAAITREASERMAVTSVQNVLDFFAGRLDPGLIVNR